MPEPLPEQAVKPRDMKQELFKGSCFFIRLIYKPFLSLKKQLFQRSRHFCRFLYTGIFASYDSVKEIQCQAAHERRHSGQGIYYEYSAGLPAADGHKFIYGHAE